MASNYPYCLAHGLLRSEHWCVQCAICFKDLKSEEECYLDKETGERWDMCHECAAEEEAAFKRGEAASDV